MGTNFNPFKSRAFRRGGLSLIFTAVVVALVILLNIVVTALSDRYPLSLDLTAGNDYTLNLDNEYLDYIKNIDNKVNIIVCVKEGDFDNGTYSENMATTLTLTDSVDGIISDKTTKYSRQTGIFLEEFTKLNSNINISYRDPSSATSFSYVTEKYPSEDIVYGDIIVECVHVAADGTESERHQILKISDIFDKSINEEMYNNLKEAYDLNGSTLASKLTSALYITNSENSVKLALYTGNGSKTPTDLEGLLKSNNYDLVDYSDITSNIDDDCKALIIYAPTQDFTKAEVDALDKYLKNNGANGRNLVYVANTDEIYSMPVLEEFLLEWGIDYDAGLVCETETNYYSQPYYVQPISAKSDYTDTLDSTKLTYPYMLSRALKASFDTSGLYTTTEILKSTDNTTVLPADAASDWSVDTSPISGPYDYLLKSSLSNSDGAVSNVVAFSSDGFFGIDAFENYLYSKDYLNSGYFANASLTLNIFNDLSGIESQNSIEITSKEITTTNFAEKVTDTAVPSIISWVFIGVIPFMLLIAGIVVFIVRKRK